MATILLDASGVTNEQGSFPVWSWSPFGMRLSEDPNEAFRNLKELTAYTLGFDPDSVDGSSAEIQQNLRFQLSLQDNDGSTSDPSMTISEWFDVLKSNSENNAISGSPDATQIYDQDDQFPHGESFFTAQNYSDTRVGGNDAINPYWQFNRDDDIVPPILAIPKGQDNQWADLTTGMGRVYAEMYDAHQRVLWIQFGVPQFINLTKLYLNSGNFSAANTMQYGALASAGVRALTFYLKCVIWPILVVPLALSVIRMIGEFKINQVSKYYKIKPAMPLYFGIINTMMSYLAVSMGIYPMFAIGRRDRSKNYSDTVNKYSDDADKYKNMAEALKDFTSSNNITEFHAINDDVKPADIENSSIPEILKGGPDIFRIMNRRARQFNANITRFTTAQLLEAQNVQSEGPFTEMFWKETTDYNYNSVNGGEDTNFTFDENIAKASEVDEWEAGALENLNSEQAKTERENASQDKPPAFLDTIKSTYLAAFDYVGFRIEKGFNTSESFSNDTSQPGIASQINAIAEKRKSELNDVGGSKFLRFMKRAIESKGQSLTQDIMTEVALGATRFMNLGEMGSILNNGSGFLSIPDVWNSSNCGNRTFSFSMQLRARYGDPVTIFQSIYIPLLMILAGGLPRSVGENMYTSPFVLKAYCKGMCAIPLGMIESISIKRGADEFGWSATGLPTCVDVDVTIKDLFPMMAAPLSGAGVFDTLESNENVMEYLDTLSALGISERMFQWQRFTRKMSASCLILKNTKLSSVWWGMTIGNSPLFRAIGALYPMGHYEKSDLGGKSYGN